MSTVPRSVHPIVFFDGLCGLCNRSVDLLLRWDGKGVLRFAPLQGETARAMLPAEQTRDLDSLVLVDAAGMHRRSDAALRALEHLGGGWRGVALLRALPRGLRDALYGLVARHRYRWFGRRESCRLPTAAERDRFLP
jgi:predicted DCC family thiol-disulfide oxidoreductase YuxK